VINYAKQQGADEIVRSTLEQMPDREFKTPTNASKAIGKID
jgi:Protein of unknown function (DUF2795)